MVLEVFFGFCRKGTFIMSVAVQGAFPEITLSGLMKSVGVRCTNECICDHLFPVPHRIWISNYKEFQFNRALSSIEVTEQIRIRGYEPANCFELLLWEGLKTCPTIIALGSKINLNGIRRVIFILHGTQNFHELFFSWGWNSNKWPEDCTFLAVKNTSDYLGL